MTTNTPRNQHDDDLTAAATTDLDASTNDSTQATNSTRTSAETADGAAASTDAPRRWTRTRTALVAGGAVVAAALLAGGVAVGAVIADELDDDDDRPAVGAPANGGAGSTGEGAGASLPADLGATSADELDAVVAAAAAAAEGSPVSIDARLDGGWDVELRTPTGDETEVRVTADGTATVVDTGRDDDEPAGTLDDATIAALFDAALAEAPGRVIELDVDDDRTSPFDVSVLTDDGRVVSIDLDAQFAVVGTELDD